MTLSFFLIPPPSLWNRVTNCHFYFSFYLIMRSGLFSLYSFFLPSIRIDNFWGPGHNHVPFSSLWIHVECILSQHNHTRWPQTLQGSQKTPDTNLILIPSIEMKGICLGGRQVSEIKIVRPGRSAPFYSCS